MRALRTFVSIASVIVIAGATGLPSAAGQETNQPPTGNIVATIQVPYTYYHADVTDPEGQQPTYSWEATISCGSWQPKPGVPSDAEWWHGEDSADPTGPLAFPSANNQVCNHSNYSNHTGQFWVEVTDGTNTIECTYIGHLGGTGPSCVDITNPNPKPKADLKVVKITGPEVAGTERKILYTAVVKNFGPDTAVDSEIVVDFVEDPFRNQPNRSMTRIPTLEATQGSCGERTCTVGDIASGGQITVKIKVRLRDIEGFIKAVVLGRSETKDPKPDNNEKRFKTEVVER